MNVVLQGKKTGGGEQYVRQFVKNMCYKKSAKNVFDIRFCPGQEEASQNLHCYFAKRGEM